MNEAGAGRVVGASDAHGRDLLIVQIAETANQQAFIELFVYFAPRIKAYVIRLGGADLADELAQEALLTVWRKSGLFDPAKASASTWIFTIARNLLIDRRRKERRPEFDPSDPFRIGLDEPLADRGISCREAELAISAALSELPAEQAKVIEMSFFEDKPHSVIAAELRVPLGTVKSRLRLAFARLRGRLERLK